MHHINKRHGRKNRIRLRRATGRRHSSTASFFSPSAPASSCCCCCCSLACGSCCAAPTPSSPAMFATMRDSRSSEVRFRPSTATKYSFRGGQRSNPSANVRAEQRPASYSKSVSHTLAFGLVLASENLCESKGWLRKARYQI